MKLKLTSSLFFYFGILTVPIIVMTAVLIIALGMMVVCNDTSVSTELITSGAESR